MPNEFASARGFVRARIGLVLAAAVTLTATAPAGADDGPSVLSEAGVVSPGHRYALRGEGWFVGPSCEPRVRISQREAHGVPVGSARIRDNGTFRFSHLVPREARRGPRIVLDVTQDCNGVGTTRTVKITIGRDRRGCGGPLSVDAKAYDLTVFGGLGCTTATKVIGAFIDTRIEPTGWICAHVDRRIAGHDFACNEQARPGRRVEARRVREV